MRMLDWLMTPGDYLREAIRIPFLAAVLVTNRRLDIFVVNALQSMLRRLSKAKLPDDSIMFYQLLQRNKQIGMLEPSIFGMVRS